MRISKILSIIIAFFMATTTINATEKEVNGQPYVQLYNGQWMPRFGIGTYNVPGDSVAEDAVSYALKCGYRHIDTAHAYRVERGVGKAIKESGIPRSEIWITSKLWPSEYGEGKTMEAIDKMLERLQTDYIDLLYVHQPMGDYRGAWRDMEKAVRQGKVRSLGISNFDASDSLFNDIMEFAEIKPAVMQIECHPYAQRKEWQQKTRQNNIQLECWFPLGGEMSNGALFKNPTIQKIAKVHGKTPAQIIIRWHIQEGFSVIPGATRHDYIKENLSVFDFYLTDEEMAQMRSLNKEKRFINMDYKQAEKFVLNWKLDD
jgi:diketogulonate reductase-like aldo/keto reductase